MRNKVYGLLAVAAVVAGASRASAAELTFNNAQFPGTGIPLAVTGSDGEVFTFSAGSGSQFEAFPSGGGSYPQGTYFLAPGLGNDTPINVSFSAPIYSIAIPVSSDRVGDSPYTSTVDFYNGSSLLGSETKAGNTLNSAEVFSFSQAITSAVISTLATSPFGYTQNIGPITYSVSPVPLPPAFATFGAALLGLGAAGSMKRRNGRVRNLESAAL